MVTRTIDHSFVQRLIDEGQLTEEEAQHAPAVQPADRLPGHPPGPADLTLSHIDRLEFGDTLLACSDGLWHYFTPKEMGAILHALPPREASEMLVSKARQRARGGGDNLSLACCASTRWPDAGALSAPARWRRPPRWPPTAPAAASTSCRARCVRHCAALPRCRCAAASLARRCCAAARAAAAAASSARLGALARTRRCGRAAWRRPTPPRRPVPTRRAAPAAGAARAPRPAWRCARRAAFARRRPCAGPRRASSSRMRAAAPAPRGAAACASARQPETAKRLLAVGLGLLVARFDRRALALRSARARPASCRLGGVRRRRPATAASQARADGHASASGRLMSARCPPRAASSARYSARLHLLQARHRARKLVRQRAFGVEHLGRRPRPTGSA